MSARRRCSMPGCDKPASARGWCKTHYNRWWKYGDPANPGAYIRGDNEARFWSKVDKNGPAPEHRSDLGPCWLWTGALHERGYGRFGIGSRSSQEYFKAHRYAYELIVGAIPSGLQLDHLCRVRRCVNPSHLEPVTQTENIRRGLCGELKTHCKRGHEFTPENTYLRPNGARVCRTCKRLSAHRKQEVA